MICIWDDLCKMGQMSHRDLTDNILCFLQLQKNYNGRHTIYGKHKKMFDRIKFRYIIKFFKICLILKFFLLFFFIFAQFLKSPK